MPSLEVDDIKSEASYLSTASAYALNPFRCATPPTPHEPACGVVAGALRPGAALMAAPMCPPRHTHVPRVPTTGHRLPLLTLVHGRCCRVTPTEAIRTWDLAVHVPTLVAIQHAGSTRTPGGRLVPRRRGYAHVRSARARCRTIRSTTKCPPRHPRAHR